MNPDIRNNRSSEAELDRKISDLLRKELPQASGNPWFTRRVMNRLPEQSRWARISIWQWICYLLGGIGFIAAIVMTANHLTATGYTETMLITIVTLSLLTLFCGGILLIPQLIRILREP